MIWSSSCFCIRFRRSSALSAPPAESNFHTVKVAMPSLLRTELESDATALCAAGSGPASPGKGERNPVSRGVARQAAAADLTRRRDEHGAAPVARRPATRFIPSG
ncbi:hypothetical protein PA7_36100 [Pseudonocardia asaccharolytica DSM 44247 = NBRC 16224]|uniref:Uncharacterized protein n=1 Tax=Pseudonocardia asaccharolytica DSM 44247 = NBRC 16224 TaxID=1123024 RepID=A0A511D5P0_9PSEU|nr:hypothetical protein PA7_36100 [Pseudonocardia asaccharolytica DSM 44247 = NBRC 16224]